MKRLAIRAGSGDSLSRKSLGTVEQIAAQMAREIQVDDDDDLPDGDADLGAKSEASDYQHLHAFLDEEEEKKRNPPPPVASPGPIQNGGGPASPVSRCRSAF